MPNKLIDLTGKTFGLYTVEARVRFDSHLGTMWRCRCQCGHTRVVSRTNLKQRGLLRAKTCRCAEPDRGGRPRKRKSLPRVLPKEVVL